MCFYESPKSTRQIENPVNPAKIIQAASMNLFLKWLWTREPTQAVVEFQIYL
jgi:hypothetical protein